MLHKAPDWYNDPAKYIALRYLVIRVPLKASNWCAVSMSNFQSLCGVAVNGGGDFSPAIDFCVVCAREKLRGNLRADSRHSFPENYFLGGGQSGNIAHFSPNAIQFCISMKVQSANNRITRFPSFIHFSVDVILRCTSLKSRTILGEKYRYVK